MLNKSFLAFALLHLAVPSICILFFGANPLWLIGSLLFAVATIRTLQETNSIMMVTLLCLLSGAVFLLSLSLGTCYYMQGEGFNEAFFYHLNSDSLVIAARTYGSVFYPSMLGLVLAMIGPAIIHRMQTQKVWSSVPILVLWILALFSNFPVYSFVNYQLDAADDPGFTGSGQQEYFEPTPEIKIEDSPQSSLVNKEPEIAKLADGIEETGKENSVTLENSSRDSEAALTERNEPPPTPIVSEPETDTEDLSRIQEEPAPKPEPRKNIILIYAESLEALYFDTDIFGDIVPNIRTLSKDAHQFTNLVQVGGTGWTIAGIVASQCGFPIKVSSHLASNSTMASVEKPYADQTCLADILSANGYQTVYMGGAPLWFAGKENFLRTHGYQRISGQDELSPRLSDKKYQSGWGIYDDSLFEMALSDLRSLEKESEPYFLTLLTLDTHHPSGIPSGSCEKLNNNPDSMSNAVYCSDQLVSGFIKEAMEIVDMDDTIIVLFSDHLSLRNTLWSKLKANRKQRRLTFMMFDDKPATVSRQRATHFDVAPTVLEAAGFADKTRLGAGKSLLSILPKDQANKQLAQSNRDAPALLNPGISTKENGVFLSRGELSLQIGDLTLKANKNGQKFVSGMYLAVFNEAGNVVDAIYSDNYQNLAKNLDGTFVIGISVMQAPPYSAAYFYGNISPDGKGITQREFNQDIELSPSVLWGSQD